LSHPRHLFKQVCNQTGRLPLGSPWTSRVGLARPFLSRHSTALSVCSRVHFKVFPWLSSQVSPIPLIGVRLVLSVAGWWVTVVSAIPDQPSGWSGPRFKWRDATTSKPPHQLPPRECHAASCYAVHYLHLVATWRRWFFSFHTCLLSAHHQPLLQSEISCQPAPVRRYSCTYSPVAELLLA
ncbi:unnamed protein product, partial [Arctogadus glacialis]